MLEFDRIYNSDCIEGMKQIESGKVDLIVTDPPYCIISYRAQEQQIKNINSNDSNKNQNMERLEEGLS